MTKLSRFVLVISFLTSLSFGALAQDRTGGSDNNNFRFSPLGLLVGIAHVGMDFKVSNEWTLGPVLSLINLDVDRSNGFDNDFEVKGSSFGVRSNWFNNGVFTDGLYVGSGLNYTNIKVETVDAGQTVTGKASMLVAIGLVGYGWFWDSFNMMLGGGLSVALGDGEVEVTDSSGTTTEEVNYAGQFALEYHLGWTF